MVTRSAEIRRYQRRGTRHVLRRAALDLLSLATSRAALARPRVQFLFLHYVMEDDERPFRVLIETLMKEHTFLSYSDAVERAASGDIDRASIALSFDDGLRNQLRAAEILRDYGLSACFFVCESMAEPRSAEEVREFCARELTLPPVDFLSWRDMEQLLAAGHEIGNHTRRHRLLTTLDAGALADEIGGALASLRRRLGDVKHFAWPRGRFHEFSAAAAAEVFRSGHASCASGERGCHVAGQKRAIAELCIRRDQIIAADPLRHSLYFLARNAARATTATSDWPPSLR